jgi:hypothetical protein
MLGTAGEVGEMGEDEVLAAAEACAETIRDAEAELVVLAYQWAVLHDPCRLDPAEAGKPGRERAKRYGGAGTPEVTEFAAADFGVRIKRSRHAAAQLIADAVDLVHRLPQLWQRVRDGEVRASYARHVAAKTRDLEPDEAAFVDAGVVESADGRICWSRFEALVEGKVAQAAPELAREREERASKATFAKKLTTDAHGMATFMVRADVATIDALDAAVGARAARLETTLPESTDDQRRVHAMLLLATGASDETDLGDLLPRVTLYLHQYAGPEAEPVARLEGHGPVTEAWVTRVLGPHCRFTVKPVLDLAGQAPVDAYEVPDRHREAVHLMTPADTFPYAASLSRDKQVDHTIPFDEGGATGVGNYGPMTLTHHRIKTHAKGWQVQQPFPGIYIWRDPHGGFHLVDHTGTRRIPSARRKPMVIEIYRQMPRIDLSLPEPRAR